MLRLCPRARTLATRAYALRIATHAGDCRDATASPRDLVKEYDLLPRDCTLLQTRSAHVAVRDHYFIFRFPPFTGITFHDRVALIAHDSAAATETLRKEFANARAADASSTGLVAFEHRVLEAVLREESQHKWDRYARLALLVRASTDPAQAEQRDWGLSWLLNTTREATVYRLITLSKSLNSLALDVKRSRSALAALLASDEDMAKTYLSFRRRSGASRSIDEHIDVELMLESFATEHEDLADRIEALQEVVSSHRALESLWLSNERNRIMRVELLLGFGTSALALSATVGGFMGMNLHSGVENVPGALWLVASGASVASMGLFTALVASVRRFHASQQTQVSRTASLERSLQGLDAAYFALRQRGVLLGDGRDHIGDEAQREVEVEHAGGVEPILITKDVLRDALDEICEGSRSTLLGDSPLLVEEVDDLWRLLDANGDGVLSASELGRSAAATDSQHSSRAVKP